MVRQTKMAGSRTAGLSESENVGQGRYRVGRGQSRSSVEVTPHVLSTGQVGRKKKNLGFSISLITVIARARVLKTCSSS